MLTWFKELFMLVGMLFSKIDLNKPIQIIAMKKFPFNRYGCMMWCGSIITKKENLKISQTTFNHEKGHLIQASFYKWWIQYYAVYLWEWIKGNPFTYPTISAYYTIPFEIQAYANEQNPNYDYNREDLKNKYTFKNRKSLYNKYKFEWIDWIKML
jgi:hypothetical protein